MAALENGLAAVSAASGQSAQFMAIATIVCVFFSFRDGMHSVYDALMIIRLVQVTTSFRGSYLLQLFCAIPEADFPHSTGLYGGVRDTHFPLRR